MSGLKADYSHVKLLLLTALVFFLIYNISFTFAESLTTGRVSILLLLVLVLFTNGITVRFLKSPIWFLLLPTFVAFIQFYFVGDFGQLSRFLHLFLYSFIGAALVVMISRDMKVTLFSLLGAISIQAIIIFYSFVSVEYRVWIDAVIVSGGNFGAENMYRAPGLAGSSGAALSVTQSFGVFVGWLLLRKNSYYRMKSKWGYAIVVFMMLISLLSCVVVGRTGLLLSLVFFMLAFVDRSFSFKAVLSISTVIGALLLFFGVILSTFTAEDFSVDYFSSWVFGVFSGDDGTIRALSEQHVPPLTIETFFGTGLNSIANSKNPSGNDSGFIQTYYSLGLAFSLFFYGFYFYVLSVVFYYFPLLIRVFLVFLIFILEAKEPFLFKYSMFFVLLAVYFSHLYYDRGRLLDISRSAP